MTLIFLKVLSGQILQKYIQPARADALLAFVSHSTAVIYELLLIK